MYLHRYIILAILVACSQSVLASSAPAKKFTMSINPIQCLRINPFDIKLVMDYVNNADRIGNRSRYSMDDKINLLSSYTDGLLMIGKKNDHYVGYYFRDQVSNRETSHKRCRELLKKKNMEVTLVWQCSKHPVSPGPECSVNALDLVKKRLSENERNNFKQKYLIIYRVIEYRED